MGWRDINMTRKRPLPRFTAVPVEPGEDLPQAVRRKAAGAAVQAATEQLEAGIPIENDWFKAFLTGYLVGFASHAALKDGVDCEAVPSGESCPDLLGALAKAVPEDWCIAFDTLGFAPRVSASRQPRSRFSLTLPGFRHAADAGFLVGHLESLCGSRKLVMMVRGRMLGGSADACQNYLTDCDVAADPMQTRAPTLSLRFDDDERKIIIAAFAEIGGPVSRTR